MPDRMPEDMPDRMPEDMSDRMPEDLPVRTCINVMVGITRSKVIFLGLDRAVQGQPIHLSWRRWMSWIRGIGNHVSSSCCMMLEAQLLSSSLMYGTLWTFVLVEAGCRVALSCWSIFWMTSKQWRKKQYWISWLRTTSVSVSRPPLDLK